jgi:diaminohydroxyphosphoribosylaminopyrimidine deaminase/5-amino-6-(5-phosphoribosylamino)uracil reductase
MGTALALAGRALGAAWPNPAVGCVLVQPREGGAGGVVVGRGWTQPSGRPHAEAEALKRAGSHARGATAYVSLEPCAHRGATPPCAEALVEAGIKRAVIAVSDPDPRVAGQGIAILSGAGVEVTTGVAETEAAEVNAGFFLRVRDGRPLVTLPGLRSRSPVRVVIDGRLRLPLTSQLVVTAREIPTWLVALPGGEPRRRRAYTDCGIEVIEAKGDEDGHLDVRIALSQLGKHGLTRVLVEGGSQLVAALLRYDLVDRIAWFRAPCIIGGDGVPAAAPFGIEELTQTPTFTRTGVFEVGDDLLETYARHP